MKILLRSIHTRQYLQSADTWTPSPENALDFQAIPLALDFVRRRSLRHMELVLFDLPATINAVPIEKLNLAQLLDDEPVPAPTRPLPPPSTAPPPEPHRPSPSAISRLSSPICHLPFAISGPWAQSRRRPDHPTHRHPARR